MGNTCQLPVLTPNLDGLVRYQITSHHGSIKFAFEFESQFSTTSHVSPQDVHRGYAVSSCREADCRCRVYIQELHSEYDYENSSPSLSIVLRFRMEDGTRSTGAWRHAL